MARPKRWFHMSQDINTDPEFQRLCDECGLAGVRFWMQVLATLDKTDNNWNIQKDWNIRTLSRLCGTKPKIILTSYALLLDMKWISLRYDDNMNHIIYAPNYMKYKGSRSHEKDIAKPVHASLLTLPSLSLPKEDKEEEGKRPILDKPKRDSPRNSAWPKDFTLTEERTRKAETYWKGKGMTFDTKITWDSFASNHKAKGSMFKDWDSAWETWYVNQVKFAKTSGGATRDHSTCPQTVKRDGKNYFEECGAPATELFRKTMICLHHFNELKAKGHVA